MKILSIAAVVALSAVSMSALAKDADKATVVDNAFTYSAVAGGAQSMVVGTAIEGDYSSQTAVSLGGDHFITGQGKFITGQGKFITGQGKFITGQGKFITGQGKFITGQGKFITGQGKFITGQGKFITGQGKFITGQGK